MLDLGYGLTNAAHRTTKGSSDLRRGDFAGSAERLERLAEELRPGILAFVGKAGYEGAFREKPALGLQAAPPRGDEGFRAPVDLASERGGFLRGAAALVSQSA